MIGKDTMRNLGSISLRVKFSPIITGDGVLSRNQLSELNTLVLII